MGELANIKNEKKYSRDEVSKILKLSAEEISEFEKEGIVEFEKEDSDRINGQNFERLKMAVSLRDELGVNIPGIDIILNMRAKIDRMQTEFEDLLSNARERLGDEIVQDLREIEANIKGRK